MASSSRNERVYTNAKAGMDDLNNEMVKRVVEETTAGSAHARNEERKDSKTDEKIEALKSKFDALSSADIERAKRQVERQKEIKEATRNFTRACVHIDMDAFFASVEQLDNPDLAGRPFAVGSESMVTTSNYVARLYGVRSAMPGFIALRLCPDLQFVQPNFSKYKKKSLQVLDTLRAFDANVELAGLDEAYLEIDPGEEGVHAKAESIRRAIELDSGLTCSCGIAPNRRLAKIASDRNKPNGQTVIEPDRQSIAHFLHSLPVRKVPGIGKVLSRLLSSVFAIATCGDLEAGLPLVYLLLSEAKFSFLLDCAIGLGPVRTAWADEAGEGSQQQRSRKGMSAERTFEPTDKNDWLEQKLDDICRRLSAQMGNETLRCRTVTLKMKLSTFEESTRQTTLDDFTDSFDLISVTAKKLLNRSRNGQKLRLIGVRLSNFEGEEGAESTGQAGQVTLAMSMLRAGNARSDEKRERDPECDECCGSVGGGEGRMCDWHFARKVQREEREARRPEAGRVESKAQRMGGEAKVTLESMWRKR